MPPIIPNENLKAIFGRTLGDYVYQTTGSWSTWLKALKENGLEREIQ